MVDVLHAEMGGIKMKTEDLYLEYARVIKMCEGTSAKPWDCIKGKNGYYFCNFNTHPEFTSNPDKYEFAVAILEGKPVFVGDKIFNIISDRFITVQPEDAFANISPVLSKVYSWKPPKQKRTFMLNGVELPCPDKESRLHPFDISGRVFYFKSPQDRNDVFNAILNMLIEARNKQ